MTIETLPSGRVVYVSVGADGHGVVRHGRATVQALTRLGVDVAEAPAEDVAGFQSLAPALASAAEDGWAVHLDVTDSLFAPTADGAADVLTQLLPPSATVTLHDVPQPAEGEQRFRRRADAYARIARHVARVVVSSQHERALLAAITDVDARVVPLPVEDRRHRASGAPLPEHLEGIDQDVVVFGFLYPGKGHREALDALAELAQQWGGQSGLQPVRVTALGPVAEGHRHLVHELDRHAAAHGLEFRVSGYVSDDVADTALRAAGVPLAAHRNVSASGSLNSWISVGRRVIVPEGRYTGEMERLRPGTLRLVPGSNGHGRFALAEAIAEAVEDPDRTWLPQHTAMAPDAEDCARLLLDVWADTHGWR